jgi:hypothetical protein
MTVSANKNMLVLGVSMCVLCMYQLEYMYQFIRTNPIVIGKECIRTICILRANYVYQ